MANFHTCLFLSCVIPILYFGCPVKGTLSIVQPFPGQKIAIEGEPVKITCNVFDFENKTLPTELYFLKVLDAFGGIRNISDGENGNYTFEKKFTLDRRHLAVTMTIGKMKKYHEGNYRCQVTKDLARFGFGITFIKRSDLPEITVSTNNVMTEFDKPVTLSCNITKQGTVFTKVTKIAWYKGGQVLLEVLHPEDEKLKNLFLKMEDPEDAGTYTCRLTSQLQFKRIYLITGNISVEVKPVLLAKDLTDNEVITSKGHSARFHCPARGNPIQIVWKRKARDSAHAQTLNDTGYLSNDTTNSKYKFSSKTKYEDFTLEIPQTEYSDRGDYYCCIQQTNGTELCQTFTLRVKDPLGYLWPLIGIIIEVIVIIIILVIAAKIKSKNVEREKNSPYRAEGCTELSYSPDGGKGFLRLRNAGVSSH